MNVLIELGSFPIGHVLRLVLPGVVLVGVSHLLRLQFPSRLFRSRVNVLLSIIQPESLSMNILVLMIGLDGAAMFSAASLPDRSPLQYFERTYDIDSTIAIFCVLLFHIAALLSVRRRIVQIFAEELELSEKVVSDAPEHSKFRSVEDCAQFHARVVVGLSSHAKARVRVLAYFILFLTIWLYFGPI